MDKTWYWSRGLHDAEIISIRRYNFDYEYTQKKPIRNCLQICLDAKNALFDTSIKHIRFYNYKLLKGDADLNGYWWINDSLSEEGGRYVLKINLRSKTEQKELEIIFEKAEVVRNQN